MKRTNFNFRDIDTFGEIQTCFSHYFPSLKINFFLNKKDTQPDNAWVMLSPEVKIGTISPDSRNGSVELNNEMTITELENSINEHFKVHSEISPIIGETNVILSQARSAANTILSK